MQQIKQGGEPLVAILQGPQPLNRQTPSISVNTSSIVLYSSLSTYFKETKMFQIF